eukprot:6754-Pleurochrysis_carterae.AAC.2
MEIDVLRRERAAVVCVRRLCAHVLRVRCMPGVSALQQLARATRIVRIARDSVRHTLPLQLCARAHREPSRARAWRYATRRPRRRRRRPRRRPSAWRAWSPPPCTSPPRPPPQPRKEPQQQQTARAKACVKPAAVKRAVWREIRPRSRAKRRRGRAWLRRLAACERWCSP